MPVRPAGAEAGDLASAIAGRAPGERASHGLLVHDRLDQDGACQHAEAQLSQHYRAHGRIYAGISRERGRADGEEEISRSLE